MKKSNPPVFGGWSVITAQFHVESANKSKTAVEMGAHAARVRFSAARRKSRLTNLFPPEQLAGVSHEGLGGPPKPARQRRPLPDPCAIHNSNFGLRVQNKKRRSEEHTSELQSLRHLVCR